MLKNSSIYSFSITYNYLNFFYFGSNGWKRQQNHLKHTELHFGVWKKIIKASWLLISWRLFLCLMPRKSERMPDTRCEFWNHFRCGRIDNLKWNLESFPKYGICVLEKHLKLRCIHERKAIGMMLWLWFDVCWNPFTIWWRSLSDQLLLWLVAFASWRFYGSIRQVLWGL
jgi:hypothetical protein